ncbi:MAG TPA: RIO1 family regulatory kinase/ATPase [Anaerolineales bacterium]|nr:RIO1 family regulatory kinase/ATPase [Anaerolineales bacterium]
MNTNDYIDFFEELDDEDRLDVRLGTDKRRPYQRMTRKLINEERQFVRKQDDSKMDELSSQKRLLRKRETKKQETDLKLFVRAQEISREFKFTYKAARFEEAWLLDSLVHFAEYQWISDVLRKVKGGKEASVYLCRSGTAVEAPLVAAKVYRPRSLRNLKNDGQYRAGRGDLDENGHVIVNSGALHAMAKRTAYGEELRHQSWIAFEFETLTALHTAGADVPRPYAMEKNAILMDYIGDIDIAAPTLNTVRLDSDEVHPLFNRVLHNIDLLLSHRRIHGDLSAYNILYWEGDISLIDFPQVVPPESNPAAWTIFLRDMTRICQYFASQGVKRDAYKLAADLWTSHGYRITKKIDPRHLDPEEQEDRRLWEQQNIEK